MLRDLIFTASYCGAIYFIQGLAEVVPLRAGHESSLHSDCFGRKWKATR